MRSLTTLIPFLVTVILLTGTSCSSTKSLSTLSSGVPAERSVQEVEASALAEGRDGETFEKAIIVNSIGEEYKWIEKKYPGSRIQGQALVRKDGKPFDILTFVTANGETKKAHFDISRFFGKGF